jgi:hypothetical protein
MQLSFYLQFASNSLNTYMQKGQEHKYIIRWTGLGNVVGGNFGGGMVTFGSYGVGQE